MTTNETLQIMAMLKVAYPRYYANQSEQDINAAVNLWTDMFSADDVQLVNVAVKAYINADTKGFPPSIGQIREKINLLMQPDGANEQEAWNMVRKAVSNSGYRAKEEFDKLPTDLQNLVGSANQLREWGLMDSGQLQTVVASNFMRSYRYNKDRERGLQSLLQGVSNQVLIDGNAEMDRYNPRTEIEIAENTTAK